MKNLLPLFASAVILAGCADDSSNPWATEQEKADSDVKIAEAAEAKTASNPAGSTGATGKKYSWTDKKAAEGAKPDEAAQPKAVEAGKAVITAIRGDAGLIAFKRAEASVAGDKLVLKKDGKSLLVVVFSVEGEAVIANIAPAQIEALSPKIGDEVSVSAFEEAAK